MFSGDVDGIVPVLGSRRWVEGLKLPVLKPWRPWTSGSGQVKLVRAGLLGFRAIIAFLGSRRWVEGLKLPVLKPWRPWTSGSGQVKLVGGQLGFRI